MTDHPITPPPPHLLKKFSAQAQDETKKRNGAGYLKTFATLCIEWAMNSQLTPNDRQIRSSEIQPPPELVRQWMERTEYDEHTWFYESYIAEQAARWGADQELEACCELVRDSDGYDAALGLRAERRPKPPSLKERALQAWAAVEAGTDDQAAMAVIRRALEQLDD